MAAARGEGGAQLSTARAGARRSRGGGWAAAAADVSGGGGALGGGGRGGRHRGGIGDGAASAAASRRGAAAVRGRRTSSGRRRRAQGHSQQPAQSQPWRAAEAARLRTPAVLGSWSARSEGRRRRARLHPRPSLALRADALDLLRPRRRMVARTGSRSSTRQRGLAVSTMAPAGPIRVGRGGEGGGAHAEERDIEGVWRLLRRIGDHLAVGVHGGGMGRGTRGGSVLPERASNSGHAAGRRRRKLEAPAEVRWAAVVGWHARHRRGGERGGRRSGGGVTAATAEGDAAASGPVGSRRRRRRRASREGRGGHLAAARLRRRF